MRGGDSCWDRPTPYLHLVSWDFTGSEPASGVYLYKASMKLEGTGETVVKTGKFAVVR